MFYNPGQSAATPRARGDIRGGCSWVCRGAAGLWGERMDGISLRTALTRPHTAQAQKRGGQVLGLWSLTAGAPALPLSGGLGSKTALQPDF